MNYAQFDNLPEEIQEVMLGEQELQTGKRNPEYFRRGITQDRKGGCFDWDIWEERMFRNVQAISEEQICSFWHEVLRCSNFDIFFQLYPKKKKFETISVGEEIFNI